MIKKLLSFLLCALIMLCMIACAKRENTNIDEIHDNTFQSETDDKLGNETNTGTPVDSNSSNETTNTKSVNTENTNTEKTTEQSNPIFATENIHRITFYAYYGKGKGSDVPNEHMTEITKWLGSFIVGDKAPELLPPGTNTYHVEIEYLDGTIIKKGLDVIAIDKTAYYLKSNKQPDCFYEIISKVSLE